jgi:hypothetical protein
MILCRKFLFVASFLLWSLMSMGQNADFEIRNFHERTTDLSAISSNYKDLNKLPAALIRFTVRDPEFEFSSNWGILGIERKTGEVYLYVPQDTKRLTIRHPRLGVLQDYEIPVRIQSKVTYGADIVITEKARPKQEPQQVVSKAPVTAPSHQPQLQPQSVSPKGKTKSDFHFYAGVGLNAVSLMGPSVNLGIRNKMFSVEGGFAYGMDKVEDVRLSFSSTVNEAYDYSCMKAWARLGVNFDTEKFRITPQAGVTFNMISGKTASGTSNTTDYFKDANPMSILAAVRLSYEVADHLRVHLTPQYDFSLGGDQIYEVIKQGDSKLKAWGEGFGINAGIIYEF